MKGDTRTSTTTLTKTTTLATGDEEENIADTKRTNVTGLLATKNDPTILTMTTNMIPAAGVLNELVMATDTTQVATQTGSNDIIPSNQLSKQNQKLRHPPSSGTSQ
jgi:hypothetical protein